MNIVSIMMVVLLSFLLISKSAIADESNNIIIKITNKSSKTVVYQTKNGDLPATGEPSGPLSIASGSSQSVGVKINPENLSGRLYFRYAYVDDYSQYCSFETTITASSNNEKEQFCTSASLQALPSSTNNGTILCYQTATYESNNPCSYTYDVGIQDK